MKKAFVIIAVGAAVLASCSKESFVSSETVKTVISAGIVQTKTSIGETSEGKRPVYWANGDKLVANGVVSNPLTDVPAESKQAQFVFDGVIEAPVKFLYPDSYYANENVVMVPASQSAISVSPMYGYSTSLAGVSMHQMMAMVNFSLVKSEDAERIVSVVLSSPTKALSGEFTLDYETGVLTSTQDPAASVKTVNVNKVLSSEPLNILVPVPAGSYDLSVKIKDESGHVMTKKATGKTFTAGSFVDFPSIAFVPTSTEIDVEISSAEEWNAFATLANADIPSYKGKVVSITADLDFTGKDVVTLGKYDGGDGYFDGSILGNNHSIKNLVSSNYLIGTVGASGLVKDLSFDSSCSFTVPYEADVQKHFGPLTEYVKGSVINCHNAAPITLAGIPEVTMTKNIFVGGLVGRIREGSVENCSNSGAITVDKSYNPETKAYCYVGGICGYSSNPDGSIIKCQNDGEITIGAWSEQVFAGGIVGNASGHVEDCRNNAMLTADHATRPTSDACKHIGLGGIAGLASKDAAFVNCTNTANGILNFKSAVKLLYAGGIISNLDGTLSEFRNNVSEGRIVSDGKARQYMFGGLIGKVAAANNFTLEGTPFTGSIYIEGYESSASSYVHLGGLIGLATDELCICAAEGKTCEIANDIQVKGEAKTLQRLSMGGVIASAGESGGDADGLPKSTEKLLTVKGIKVSGNVKVTGSALVIKFKFCQIGGIVGGAWSGVNIQDCEVAGKYYFGDANMSSGANGNMVHIGGVAGRVEGGDSVIKNCKSQAKCYNYQYNNNNWDISTHQGCCAQGCVLGSFGYNLGNTAKCEISSCAMSDKAGAYGYRGVSGGVAGFADKTTVDNCTFIDSYISRGAPAGGIIGAAVECKVSNCTINTSDTGIKATGAGSCVPDAGGVIGKAVASSVDNCSVFGLIVADASKSGLAGGLIGAPDAQCTIAAAAACRFGGTIGTTAVTADNVASLAIGNTAITPGTVNYWDGK